MRERIELRGVRIADQLAGKELPVAKFGADGTAHPVGWRPEYDRGEPTMDQPTFEGRARFISARINERTHGSWRTQMFLARGRYRVEGLVRTEAFKRRNHAANFGRRTATTARATHPRGEKSRTTSKIPEGSMWNSCAISRLRRAMSGTTWTRSASGNFRHKPSSWERSSSAR
jgi:hypothetical protein